MKQTFPAPPEPTISHCRREKLKPFFRLQFNLSHRNSHKSTFHRHSESHCETEAKLFLIVCFFSSRPPSVLLSFEWLKTLPKPISFITQLGSWVNVAKHASVTSQRRIFCRNAFEPFYLISFRRKFFLMIYGFSGTSMKILLPTFHRFSNAFARLVASHEWKFLFRNLLIFSSFARVMK